MASLVLVVTSLEDVTADLVIEALNARAAPVARVDPADIGRELVEIGDHGFRRPAWEELELVDHWRRYLAAPHAYLRHIVAP